MTKQLKNYKQRLEAQISLNYKPKKTRQVYLLIFHVPFIRLF